MAGRSQPVVNNTQAKADRLQALRALEGAPLPLPTQARTEPAEYSDDIPAEVLALAAEGLSEAQIAHHLAVDVETLRAWGDGRPEMKAALSRARTAMRAWWEERARRAIVTGDNRFPAGAWSQVMRARFSEYDDKPTVHIDLSGLVMIQRPEPPTERAVIEAKPLNVRESVKLLNSQTVGNGGSQASQMPCDDPGEGQADGATNSHG